MKSLSVTCRLHAAITSMTAMASLIFPDPGCVGVGDRDETDPRVVSQCSDMI